MPFDNLLKRIWIAGEQTGPLPGGNSGEFFANWLSHGTGGTCFSINGGLYALTQSAGFEARLIAGTVIVEGFTRDTNHGSVVNLEGVDYPVDGNIGSFNVLPLDSNRPTSSGESIHDIQAMPLDGGFDVFWYTGIDRTGPLVFRTDPKYDPVEHAFFLDRYDSSKEFSPFNEAVYICRRFPDSIVTVGRNKRLDVGLNNTVSTTEISAEDRKRVLIEDLGISEEIADALPPDVPGGTALL